MPKRTRKSFEPVEPKVKWTEEKTLERITVTKERVAEYNRQMLKMDSQINDIKDHKLHIRDLISRTNKYLKQLEKQLIEQQNWTEI